MKFVPPDENYVIRKVNIPISGHVSKFEHSYYSGL